MEDTPPRKRGAPRGNRNAVKHGFYSQLNHKEQRPSLPSAEIQSQPDILLFRAFIARLTAGLASGQVAPATFADDLAILHLVCIAVARLNSLWRTNERLFKNGDPGLFNAFKSVGFTAEQLQSDIFLTPRHPRGCPPGAANALKHGFYASAPSPAENPASEPASENKESPSVDSEIALLRVLTLRTYSAMSASTGLDLALHLRTLRIVTMAVTIIEKLERHKTPAFSDPYRLEELIDRIIQKESKNPGE